LVFQLRVEALWKQPASGISACQLWQTRHIGFDRLIYSAESCKANSASRPIAQRFQPSADLRGNAECDADQNTKYSLIY
jgi:hypothetical protein